MFHIRLSLLEDLPYVHIKAISSLLLHSDLWRKKLKLPLVNFLTFKVIFGLPSSATLQKNYLCKNCLCSQNSSETHSLKNISHSKLFMTIYQMKDIRKKKKKWKRLALWKHFWAFFSISATELTLKSQQELKKKKLKHSHCFPEQNKHQVLALQEINK